MKIKVITDKPKTLAVSISAEQLTELCDYLLDDKLKKFDIILNGHMVKIQSSVAKKALISGLTTAQKILNEKMYKVDRKYSENLNKLTAELNHLKQSGGDIQKLKDEAFVKETSYQIKVAAWIDRITELEDTCNTLRNIVNEMAKNNSNINTNGM